MNFLSSIIKLIIFFGILYLIFTNFGTFLMIVGGVFVTIFLIIYFIKKEIQKRARNFEFKFENFSNQNYQNFDFKEFKNFDFNQFNNKNFNTNFYNQASKKDEAKEFFGFTSNPNKEDIKKRYKELAKKYHPDLNGGNDEKMKKLNEYRDVLMQIYGN